MFTHYHLTCGSTYSSRSIQFMFLYHHYTPYFPMHFSAILHCVYAPLQHSSKLHKFKRFWDLTYNKMIPKYWKRIDGKLDNKDVKSLSLSLLHDNSICMSLYMWPDDDPQAGAVAFTEPTLELTDEVEEAHAAILEKLDEIKRLRDRLRRDYVPSTVVTNLEQCIKETEVRIKFGRCCRDI